MGHGKTYRISAHEMGPVNLSLTHLNRVKLEARLTGCDLSCVMRKPALSISEKVQISDHTVTLQLISAFAFAT